MQPKNSQHKFFILIALILMCGCYDLLSAQENTKHPTEILIRIGQPEKTLDTIDEMLGLEPVQPMNSCTNQLRKMLVCTNWIDPTRSKVLKETKRQREIEEKTSAEEEVDMVQYWLDQGILYSMYGNHPEAIKYFKKVIELSPQDSNPHFNLGISYGELGEYEKAISSLDKALEINPENGLYLYGRGRVYLLSGDKNKAMEDFKRAAVLGHREAQDYLEAMTHLNGKSIEDPSEKAPAPPGRGSP